MMFAGMTSAYIVKKNQSSWLQFDLPLIFWYSTAVILASSLTMYLATKAMKAREMSRYRTLITITAGLGLAFLVMQYLGFKDLEARDIALIGPKSNSAASFLFVITVLHMLHVLGGVIAILIVFAKAFRSTVKNYSAVPVEVVGTYWHFVDALWIYLFLFYNWIG
ncbi:MAG: cytochrome oxidase subunit III [Bacteroidetes bacterium 24-39-8]|nr:MAG: cytochrome oxidase subunit III [Sphingobacteriia bacterium 35-40-8]OYZ51440.1 MAG: cytochrome oxidase subunit III [Bacteroidetes bacterium 24-39-8]OZA65924.1 MAG: cytochrome oxidase subunit III [Sphingobacteriia bacterium 39-39-8]